MLRLVALLLFSLAAIGSDVVMKAERVPGLFEQPFVRIPVLVTLEVPSGEFSGTLTAEANAGYQLPVRERVDLRTGTFAFWLYPWADLTADQLVVTLKDGSGEVLLSKTLALSWAMGDGYGQSLALVRPELVKELPVEFKSIGDKRYLPDRWYGYQGVTLLVWDGSLRADLSSMQQKALYEWLVQGGRLLIVTEPGETLATSPIPAYAKGWKDALPWVRVGDGFVQYTQVEQGAVSAGSEKRLAVEWPEGDDYWRSTHGGLADLVDGQLRFLNLALDDFFPDLSPVIYMGLVYLVLVSLGDWLLGRLTGWRRLTWVTFPLAIGLFSWYGWTTFQRDNPWMYGAQITVMDRVDGTDQWQRLDHIRWRTAPNEVKELRVPTQAQVTHSAERDVRGGFHYQAGDQLTMRLAVEGEAQDVTVTSDALRGDSEGVIVQQMVERAAPMLRVSMEEQKDGRVVCKVNLPSDRGQGILVFRDKLYRIRADGQIANPADSHEIDFEHGLEEATGGVLNGWFIVMKRWSVEDHMHYRRAEAYVASDTMGLRKLDDDEVYVTWMGLVERDMMGGPGPRFLVVRERQRVVIARASE